MLQFDEAKISNCMTIDPVTPVMRQQVAAYRLVYVAVKPACRPRGGVDNDRI